MRIKKASANELEKVSNLYRTVVDKIPYYSLFAKRHEKKKFTATALETAIKDRNNLFIVAKDNNNILGAVNGFYQVDVFWIDWLVVDSPYQHKGIGMALMNSLEEMVKRQGVHKIWNDTRTENKASIKLLKKLGFKKIATVKNHWYKRDFYIWEKEIE